MKINEIVSETKEHIRLYWLLKSIDIDLFNSVFNDLKIVIRSTNDQTVKGTMIEMYSRLYDLLSNPDWENLEDDSEFDMVYDSLIDLLDNIKNEIEN